MSSTKAGADRQHSTFGIPMTAPRPCHASRLTTHAYPQAQDNQKPDYLKLNPNGRVPMIVHEGTPIWESAAITM